MNECGCNDWMTTQRSAMMRAQGHRVPLPRAILEGANAAVCRRDFLRNGALGFLTVYGASSLSWGKIWEAASAQAATPTTDPIIVSIFLDGGNDGINTLVPIDSTNYAAYLAARPHIGFTDQSALLPLGGAAANPDFAWNPAATGFQSLYDAGKMAVIPAVDYSPPDLSHFHSRAFWQAGYLETDPTTGWLGRWIDQNGVKDNPLQALSINWTLEESMRSAKNPVAVLTSPDAAQFDMNNVWRDTDLMTQTLGGLTSRPGSNPAMRAADDAVGGAVSVANRLKSLGTTTIPPTGFGYGTTDFDDQMSTLSWLIRSNLGLRVACLSYSGGFDFHDDQKNRQAANLAGLGQTLQAFQADLEANGIADKVITLVWSEFGRRIEDNDSNGGGTDHGAGGLAMVVGSQVNGGVVSEFPGLTDLDGNGNLKVPTDYRQIYTELLGSWMGTDPAAVIPDAASYAPLPLVA